MKRKLPILALLLVGLVGCTYNTLPDDVAVPVVGGEQGFDLNLSTRAEVFDGKQLDSEYFVAEQDLESYLTYKQQHSGKKITVKNCTPYGFDGGHTLFYVLNYADGWEVVSADKRTQATLAYGDGSRTFSMGADNTNEAEKFWMELLASDVLQKRQRTHSTRSAEGESLVADEEEQSNVAFWNRVCNNSTRVIEVGSTSELSSPNTVYYVLGSTIDTLTTEKGPLLQTSWGQGYPWNAKCPLKSNSSIERAPAGCAAVATAQLLYYLQQNLYWDLQIPIDVSTTGNINNYTMVFSNTYSHSIWGAMALDEDAENWDGGPIDIVAVLLAWLGDRLPISYGNNESSGALSGIPLFLRREYHIGAITDVYSFDDVQHQIMNRNRPVILCAERRLYQYIYEEIYQSHAWIADGIRNVQRVDTVYYLVVDNALSNEELTQYTIEDATHLIKYRLDDFYLHMNWGWDGINDGYYSTTPSSWDGYQYGPFMVAGFTKIVGL